MNLKQKTIKGLLWSFVAQGGKQASQFVITAILARLLTPNAFGLLAMATVFTNFVTIFGELGISSALIQKQDTHDRHYFSAFWLNLFVGFCLMIILMLCSPLIAGFYKKPELTPILMVLSVNLFISSFVIIQQTILTKAMDFKRLAVRDIIAIPIAGMVGITLAYQGLGVWSLVCQTLTSTLMNAFLLWTVSSWRPKFAFAISDIKDIFYFSANLTGFNVINYFARNIDQLLIGRLLGPQALGFYSLANKIMLYPIQNITGVINRVVFPAFSKIQKEKDKIRSSYLMMVKSIATLTFPLMLGLFVITPEFVRIILGANWESAIPLIMILSFCGLVQSVGGPLVGNIRLSQGRIDLHLQIGIMNAILVIITVLIGLRWGIMGVTLSYTLYSFFWFFLTNTITLPLIHLKTTDLLKTLRKPIFLGLIFSCCIFLLKQRVKPHDLISLLFIIAIGIIVYSLILFLSKTFKDFNNSEWQATSYQ